jgi:hypothetical protein
MMPIVFGAKAAGVEAVELTMLAAVYPNEPWVHSGTPAASAANKGKTRLVVCSLHKQSAWEGMNILASTHAVALSSVFAVTSRRAFRATVVSGMRASRRVRRQRKPFGAARTFPVNTVMV